MSRSSFTSDKNDLKIIIEELEIINLNISPSWN